MAAFLALLIGGAGIYSLDALLWRGHKARAEPAGSEPRMMQRGRATPWRRRTRQPPPAI
jgi:hypothetical protein